MVFKTHFKKKSTEEGKLAGVMIPIEVHSYLTLYAIVNEITKSCLLRPLIEAWYKRTIKKFPNEILISTLIKAAQHEWDVRKKLKTEGSFLDYLEEIRKDLNGVDMNIINSIQRHIIQ